MAIQMVPEGASIFACSKCHNNITITEQDQYWDTRCPVCHSVYYTPTLFARVLNDLTVEGSTLEARVTRHVAAGLLGQLDPSCASLVVEPLTRALNDPSCYVRSEAAKSLSLVRPHDHRPLQLLIEWAKYPDADIRQDCSRKLGDLKTQDEGAVRVLMDNLASDPDAEVRKQAAFSLGQMVPSSKAAIPVLRKALNDSNSEVRLEAAVAFQNFGPLAKEAIHDLEEAINRFREEQDYYFRDSATLALGDMGPESCSILMKLFTGNDENVRFRAAFGLSKMGVHALPALEDFIEALEDDSAAVVRESINCLANLGKAAQRAVPKIKKAMASFPDNGSVQQAGMEALSRIAGGVD